MFIECGLWCIEVEKMQEFKRTEFALNIWNTIYYNLQWRIQDFEEGALTYYLGAFFTESCVKMKDFALGMHSP